jgi:uncharacterized membrane-anchored protein
MPPSSSKPVSDPLNKVPIVTLGFWMTRIMSTTVAETGADLLPSSPGLTGRRNGTLV